MDPHELLPSGNLFDSSCCSNAMTLHCNSGYFIKINDKEELALEAALGYRFFSLGFGVKVVQYISSDKDYLVTQSAVGVNLTHCLDEPKSCVICSHPHLVDYIASR